MGCSLYEVPPGRRAWPYHYHLATEEAVYVLEGSGTLRIGGEEIEISEGDYVALPARAQAAHQIINDSGAVLRYLCFSTMVEPDVMIYPDSGKVGIFGGANSREPKAKVRKIAESISRQSSDDMSSLRGRKESSPGTAITILIYASFTGCPPDSIDW